jgi:lysophospholipase L1-like esterase
MHILAARAFVRTLCCLIGLLVLQTPPARAAQLLAAPTLPHVAERIAAGQTLRITAFGSSSTEGIGATTKDRCYPSRLQAALAAALPKGVAVSVLNRGIGGEDVDDMMARLPAIMAEKPDLVIWQTGSNDSLRGVGLDHFVAATRDGIARMQAAGIDVMLMEPQLSQRLAATDRSDDFLVAVRKLGEATHVPVIRRYDLMSQWLTSGTLTYTQMMSGDGLHMTDGGYELLARAVAGAIIADSDAVGPHVASR